MFVIHWLKPDYSYLILRVTSLRLGSGCFWGYSMVCWEVLPTVWWLSSVFPESNVYSRLRNHIIIFQKCEREAFCPNGIHREPQYMKQIFGNGVGNSSWLIRVLPAHTSWACTVPFLGIPWGDALHTTGIHKGHTSQVSASSPVHRVWWATPVHKVNGVRTSHAVQRTPCHHRTITHKQHPNLWRSQLCNGKMTF